jgi:quinol monooxygenase YgiN
MKNPIISFLGTLTLTILLSLNTMAQDKEHMVRMAKIKVDPHQLNAYNSALKEQMNTAIKLEPGVLSYYAVAEKADPSVITIIEVYADTVAYKSHIETPHFKKYKARVQDMVKSLQLVELDIIGVARKPGM